MAQIDVMEFYRQNGRFPNEQDVAAFNAREQARIAVKPRIPQEKPTTVNDIIGNLLGKLPMGQQPKELQEKPKFTDVWQTGYAPTDALMNLLLEGKLPNKGGK